MASLRSRLMVTVVAAAVGTAVLGLAPAASADDHHHHHHHHADDGYPVLVVSPAPGKLTQEHKVTDTYQYAPKASGGSSTTPEESSAAQSSSASASASEPGAVSSAKDAANSTGQSATSGLSSTVNSLLK
ncbi:MULTISPECIES: hypothetical protein [Streptomyces]|uniref:hypothetical protein n=1 Tax=Streptomyces TaxID=1883 RepID=UPI001CCEBB4C|nr:MULTISPECIES: hypothetical protein [Streptomyces]UBI41240.1 hypothetical protein K7I03_23485 [Streptomyces mobaraensis]UKW33738.1 hypothetical protein MCU78_23430 [Streptomyces sp. TYQ1024]